MKDFTPTVAAFNEDVKRNTGYIYSTNASLSSRLANARMTRASLAGASFAAKRVIDVGCGDGAFSIAIYDQGHPHELVGIDPADQAVAIAAAQAGQRKMSFAVESAYDLPYPANSFDIAYLRGVLHHMDRPVRALREALRVAPVVVVVEPNGYNPVLKLLERFSGYHVAHHEKSYPPRRLDRWSARLGGEVISRQWVGLVPMFCPDWLARPLKLVEPLVERLPLINLLGCAQYVFVIRQSR